MPFTAPRRGQSARSFNHRDPRGACSGIGRVRAGTLVAIIVVGQPCLAQDGGWTTHWENDRADLTRLIICPPQGTSEAPSVEALAQFPRRASSEPPCESDRYYTNGFRVIRTLPNRLPWKRLEPGSRSRSFGTAWFVGQHIYTPADLKTSALIPDDRPYGGWLYGGVAVVATTRRSFNEVELTLGVVGPASGAGPTQRAVHSVLRSLFGSGAVDPKGWPNQIRPSGFAAQGQYEWRWRPGFLSHGVWDLTPHVRGALGHVFVLAGGGFTLRFGSSLPDDFGPGPGVLAARPKGEVPGPQMPPVPERLQQQPVVVVEREPSFVYVFYRNEVWRSGYNVFLDRAPSTVERRPWVWQAEFGFRTRRFNLPWLLPAMDATWRVARRSSEFEGQATDFQYGSWQVTWYRRTK